MLMLLGSSSLAYANEDVTVDGTEIDIELLEFIGDTAGLESLGVDIDGLLGIEDNANSYWSGGSDEN